MSDLPTDQKEQISAQSKKQPKALSDLLDDMKTQALEKVETKVPTKDNEEKKKEVMTEE